MKIIFQDETRRLELDTDVTDVHGVIDEICSLLIGWGFHPESVKEGILTKAEEYENKKASKPKK